MTFYTVLIDLILLLIIAVSVYFAARRGFVRTFVEAVGFIAAGILALTICTPLANATYDKIIEPPLLKIVTERVNASFEDKLQQIPDFDVDSEEYQDVKENIDTYITEVFEQLPDYLKNYVNQSGLKPQEFFGDSDVAIKDSVSIEEAVQKLAVDISQNQIKPLVSQMISVVYSTLILVLSLIIVKILAKVINKAFSFSIAGKLNTALGGLCGLAKGLIFALLLCTLIYVLIPFTENGIWIFTLENIEKTFIFKTLISLIEI